MGTGFLMRKPPQSRPAGRLHSLQVFRAGHGPAERRVVRGPVITVYYPSENEWEVMKGTIFRK